MRRLPLAASALTLAAVTVLAGCSSTGETTSTGASTSSSSSPAASGGSAEAHGAFPEAGSTVGPETFQQGIDAGAVLIDVRTPEEFAAGHIKGAQNIDVQDPAGQAALGALDKSQHYAVYCRSGNRSQAAMAVMAGAGVTNAFDLDGGVGLWQQAGYALVTD